MLHISQDGFQTLVADIRIAADTNLVFAYGLEGNVLVVKSFEFVDQCSQQVRMRNEDLNYSLPDTSQFLDLLTKSF